MYRLALYLSFFGMLFISITVPSCNRATENKTSDAAYTGSASCAACHEKEYKAWQQSDHSKAMLPAADSTVSAAFNGAMHTDGMQHIFHKKEGKYYIETEGEDGKMQLFEVLYTLGYFPLQQYICRLPGGRFQVFRASWDSKSNKWFMQLAGQTVKAGTWLHWTGNAQNWNTMCASCHTTGYEKNYNAVTDTYNSQWKENGAGCESCHGPGSNHIAYIGSEAYKQGERQTGSYLLYAADTTQTIQINTCAPCHARKTDIQPTPPGTAEIMNHLIPETPDHEAFFADGQIKEEDYEYSSFLQSKMYRMHVRCSHCHDAHSGKTRVAGNALCLNCHTANYNSAAHHFHAPNTEASQCISCHMPSRTYMGNDLRRDHSFRLPRPDLSVKYGTPNTCNSCHTNRSAAWAAQAIAGRKGTQRPYHFSEDLLEGARGGETGEKALVHLLHDTLQPAIARAAATVYLSRYASETAWKTLLLHLHDASAVVRYQCLLSLQDVPDYIWQQAAFSLLSDPVAGVRLAAAQLYQNLPIDQLSAGQQAIWKQAAAEYFQFLQQQTDFAIGNVMLADYYLNLNQASMASQWYERALKKDPELTYALKNLAVAYNSEGKNDKALKLLTSAAATHPKDPDLQYQLALLYHETKQTAKAKSCFIQARKLGMQSEALYYNYAMLLQELNETAQALAELKKGFAAYPSSERLCYALFILYHQQNKTAEARQYLALLYKAAPESAAYHDAYRWYGFLK